MLRAWASKFNAVVRRAWGTAVGWNYAVLMLRVGGLLVSTPLILRIVPPEELAFWYLFQSIAALSAFLDLGFAHTTSRVVGNAWGGAPDIQAQGIMQAESTSREPNWLLFQRILGALQFFYRSMSWVCLVLVGTAGGVYVWWRSGDLEQAGVIRLAWVCFVLGGFLNFRSGFWPSVLVGCNGVRTYQQIIFAGLLVYYVVILAGLWSGLSLWALVWSQIVMAVFNRTSARRAVRHLVRPEVRLEGLKLDKTVLERLWPNSWRMAVSGLGASLTAQSAMLICSAYLPLQMTASLGLSVQASNLLMLTANAWVIMKFPLINQLRVQGRSGEIATLFRQRLLLSYLTFMVGGLVAVFLGNPVLAWLGAKTLMLPAALLALYFVTQLGELHFGLHMHLVLSENKNPFIWPIFASGMVTALAAWIVVKWWGLAGVLAAVLLVQGGWNYWWVVKRAAHGLGLGARHYLAGFGRDAMSIRTILHKT